MGLQGVDGVDMGFCNTFYQVFFPHPDANTFNFIYYFLGLIGALWEKFFGSYGLLGFRLLELLTLSGAITLMYATFHDVLTRRYVGLAIILSFVFPTMFVTFHYNTLSFLFISVSAYCYKKSVFSDKSFWLLLAGVAIGMAFFVRIVNGTLFVLLIIPLIYYWRTRNALHAVKKAAIMLGGVACGMSCIILIIFMLGQETYYMDALREAFATFQGSEATHSHGHLVGRYFKSFVNVILQIVTILILYYAYQKSCSFPSKWKHLAFVLLTIVFLILSYTSHPYLTAFSLCVILILYGCIRKNSCTSDKMGIVCVYLLVAAVVYPFGSDIGVQGVFNWCAGLLIFPAMWCVSQFVMPERVKPLKVAFFSILICAVLRTVLYVYGEDVSRFACTEQIHSERLNVFTTPEKAARYAHTINAINQYVGENRLLFVTNQASELYYATRTLPFEGHVQPVIYRGERLIWRLNERLAHFGEYPLIAMLNQEKPSSETSEVQSITKQWMKRHRYQLVYDDGYLKLYACKQSDRYKIIAP